MLSTFNVEEAERDPQLESVKLKAPQSVLNNYFSIGSDANTALQVGYVHAFVCTRAR